MEDLNDFSDEVEDEVEFMRVDEMGEESQFMDSDSSGDELEMFGRNQMMQKPGHNSLGIDKVHSAVTSDHQQSLDMIS